MSPEGDLQPLAFTLVFPDGPPCPVDFTRVACPRLIRPLLAALRRRSQVGGRIGSRATGYSYAGSLRKLDAFLAGRLTRPAEMSLQDLSPDLLDAFEVHLAGEVPHPRTGYGFFVNLIVLLRDLRDSMPATLHPEMPARLRFTVMATPYPQASTDAVDAYPPQVAAKLRAACRQQIRDAVQRITVTGEALLSAGGDPRIHGWENRANLLWEISQRGVMTSEELAAETGCTLKWAGRQGLIALHELLYPTNTDLAALAVLAALDTGLEPEALRNLTTACLKPNLRHVRNVDLRVDLRERAAGRVCLLAT